MEKRVKLSAFAKSQGITYQAAWKMWERGEIEGIKLESGTILVSGWTRKITGTPQVIIYARIASPEFLEDLEAKIKQATEYAEYSEYEVVRVVKEIVSGINYDRPKLHQIFEIPNWDILLVCDANEITSINFDLVKAIVASSGKRLEVINPIPEDEKNLLVELTQRTIGWAKQIIGMNNYKNNVIQIIRKLNK